MFRGEFRHQLDAKNRLRIPAKLRAELGEQFVVYRGGGGGLFVFPQKQEERIAQAIANVPLSDAEAQNAIREWSASSADVENDDQGRCLIPQNLRDYAKIDKNIVIAGAGTRIEIWSEQAWDNRTPGSYVLTDFDKLLTALSKYGI